MYLKEDGFRATPMASVLVPQKAPNTEIKQDMYIYTSRPGDVLFFQESWGHLVYTHVGPSLMINYRNMVVKNFLRQPITYFTAMFNHLVLGAGLVDNNKETNTWPKQELPFVERSINKLNAAVCPDGNLTVFDESMIATLRAAIERDTK